MATIRRRRRLAWTLMAGTMTGIAAALCIASAGAKAARDRDILASYRNKNRVLLAFAPSRGDARYQRQSALLDAQASGLNERDLILIYALADGKGYRIGTRLFGSGGENALRSRFGVRPRQFRVILIGKDGHEAYSGDQPITPGRLFGLIDAMPMRRDEMRRQKRPSGDKGL